jgi:hypothetical protein
LVVVVVGALVLAAVVVGYVVKRTGRQWAVDGTR